MDNSFTKIISDGLGGLVNIFSSDKSKSEALGIDIGLSSIKVVQLKKKGGKAILETYGVLALGPYGNQEIGSVTNLSADDVSKALIDVMRESNVTTKSGIVAIPSMSSLIFTITLPSKVSERDLGQIIPIEARKYIPVPISEVVLDWFIIPNEAESFDSDDKSGNITQNKMEILVVAIHNETLSRYQDILKKTDLLSDSFEMEIFSNIRSSLGHDIAPVLLIDFGASKTKVSIVESGIVRVFHVVNRGSQDITRNISQSLSVSFSEAEKLKRSIGLNANADPKVADICKSSTDYILSDINSVVLAFEKKYNKSISKVVLVGGGSMLNGLLSKTKENFRVDVFYSNPFSKVEAPAFLSPVLENSGPEFAVALGLALRQLSQ